MRPLVVPLLFLCLLLAGCAKPEPACYQVGFPAVGAGVTYDIAYVDSEGKTTSEDVLGYTATAVTSTLAGDGLPRQTIVFERSVTGATHFIDLQSTDQVRYDPGIGVEDYRINRNSVILGNAFYARCLAADMTWQRPYGAPGFNVSASVVTATHAGAAALLDFEHVPPAVKGEHGLPSMNARFRWSGSGLFADKIEIFEGEVDRSARAIYTLRTSTDALGPGAPPAPATVPVRNDFDAWPALNVETPLASYEDFRAAADASDDLRAYMANHPDAFVAYLFYELIDEPESEAARWNALIRDSSDEGFEFEMVRRCFDNPALQLAYGECRDDPSYFQIEMGAVQVVEGATAPTGAIAALEAQALASAFRQDQAPVGIEWRGHPLNPPHGAYGFTPGRPGWIFEYGSINGTVDYWYPAGPRGVTLTHDTISVPVDGAGWVLEYWRTSMFNDTASPTTRSAKAAH